MQGYIIVIEGTDGCGKQTQAKLLLNKLTKLIPNHVFEISFPNYASKGCAPVKMYLDGTLSEHAQDVDAYQASILFATDRLCTYYTDIKAHYEAGDVIIIDRYTPSNALHQAGKIANLRDRDKYLDWLFDLEYNKLHLPSPDKVIFLNVPTEVSQKLRAEREKAQGFKSGTAKDIHEQDPKHLENAYASGMYVSLKYGWDIIACTKGDNMLSIDEIADKIYKTLSNDKRFKEIISKY